MGHATFANWKRFAHSHFYIAVIKTAAADLNEPVAMETVFSFFFFSLWLSESCSSRLLYNYFASSLTQFMTISPVKAVLGHHQD